LLNNGPVPIEEEFFVDATSINGAKYSTIQYF
jgi:hypothetical protein